MLYELTVPQYKKMLGNLSVILDKAEAHFKEMKVADETILGLRLAPDMFPFSKQIQAVCDNAKFIVSDLGGKKTTENTYTETTLAQLQDRIKDALTALNSVSKDDFNGAEEKLVTQFYWKGKHMAGYDFVVQHSIPNFYFHTMTAYSILRSNGLQIGKRDYLGTAPYKE